jgi:multiple sugar transport system substrate-binding protein
MHSIFTELIDRFEADHSDIAIHLVDLDVLLDVDPAQSLGDEALLRVAQGVDSMIWRWPPLYSGQALLMDLAPWIEADSVFDADDFYPNLLDADQGRIFFIPANAYLDVLFYNKTLFDAAGLPYPQPGWTRAEFLETVTSLTQVDATTGETVQYGFLDTWPNGLEFVLLSASELIDTKPSLNVHLDKPEMIKAVQRYHQLVADGVAPALYDLSEEQYSLETNRLINGGRVAVWTDAIDNLDYRVEHQQRVGVVTFPRPETGVGVPLYPGTRYAISAGTTRPEAAWRWLSWLSRQDLRGLSAYSSPTRRSLAEALSVWSSLPESLAANYQWALAHPTTWSSAKYELFASLSPASRNQILSTLQHALRRVLAGETTVEVALATAQTQAAEVFGMDHQTIGPTPTAFTVVVPTATPPAADVVPITFITDSPSQIPVLETLATAFHQVEERIEVRVKLFELPLKTGTFQVTTQSLAEQGDCFVRGATLTDDDLKVLLSLDPLIEADFRFELNDFYPITLVGLRRDGALWGLPAGGVVRLLHYNRDIFDQGDIPYPQPGWTLDDWLDTARALRQAQEDPGEYPFLSFGEALDGDYVLAQRGATRYVPGSDPPQPQFDEITVVSALNWYLDLARVHQVKPQYAFAGPDNLPDWDTNLALIDDDWVAMWFTIETGDSKVYTETLNLGYAPMPRNPDGLYRPDYVFSRAYFIGADVDPAQADACWRWISYLTTQAELVTGLAPRRSVFASDAYRARVPADLYAVYAYVLDQEGEAEQFGRLGERPEISLVPADYWFWQAIDAHLAGQDLQLVLVEAQRKAEEYIACMTKENKPEEMVLSCAHKVDPNYPGQ